MVDFYIGTMRFSYKDWAGAFYPPSLAASDYLSYYSRIFNAVEIDSTFYGTPKIGSVTRWRENSPDGFKICVKVPRSITHDARLINVQTEMADFIQTVNSLGEKLSVVLIQFPPSYTNSNPSLLSEFLGALPKHRRYAVEFRNSSWYTKQTAAMLSKYDVCWAATEFQGVPKEVELTTDLIFIRLVGQHGRFQSHDREQVDVTPQLEAWWQWIRSQSDAIRAVYVFFNDDFSGHAPAAANKLKKVIGLPVIKSDFPKQMKLF